MAWYNGGDWGGIRIGLGSSLFEELKTAVWERLTLLQMGTGIIPPTYSDVRVSTRGIEQLRTQIERMVNPSVVTAAKRFIKETNGADWTITDLLASSGYGAAWLSLSSYRPQDPRPLIQVRNCLDLLKFHKKRFDSGNFMVSMSGLTNRYGSGGGTTWEESWASALANTIVRPNTAHYQIHYNAWNHSMIQICSRTVPRTLDCGTYYGTPLKAETQYQEMVQGYSFGSPDPMEYTDGFNVLTADENADSTNMIKYRFVNVTLPKAAFSGSFLLHQLSCEPPSEHPFYPYTDPGGYDGQQRQVNYPSQLPCDVYYELVPGVHLTYG